MKHLQHHFVISVFLIFCCHFTFSSLLLRECPSAMLCYAMKRTGTSINIVHCPENYLEEIDLRSWVWLNTASTAFYRRVCGTARETALHCSGKKFRIGTSLAELAVVRASRMKIIHVVTVINSTFPVTDKVIYTFIYYYLMEKRPYIQEKMKFRYGNLALLCATRLIIDK